MGVSGRARGEKKRLGPRFTHGSSGYAGLPHLKPFAASAASAQNRRMRQGASPHAERSFTGDTSTTSLGAPIARSSTSSREVMVAGSSKRSTANLRFASCNSHVRMPTKAGKGEAEEAPGGTANWYLWKGGKSRGAQ